MGANRSKPTGRAAFLYSRRNRRYSFLYSRRHSRHLYIRRYGRGVQLAVHLAEKPLCTEGSTTFLQGGTANLDIHIVRAFIVSIRRYSRHECLHHRRVMCWINTCLQLMKLPYSLACDTHDTDLQNNVLNFLAKRSEQKGQPLVFKDCSLVALYEDDFACLSKVY